MMIRYLEQGEKEQCRKLWEEAFPEDRDGFLDYYMKEKASSNRILVWEEQGEILSMLHRNPYVIKAGERKWNCDYIVGVATAKKARRRGYMRSLMTKALQDMKEEGMPFCFLMPANERLYMPFGFTCIFQGPFWELNDSGKKLEAYRLEEKMSEEQAAAWMEKWLSSRFQVYTERTGSYVKTLKEELASECGYLEALLDGERIVGIRGLWGEGNTEQRLLYAEDGYTREKTGHQPPIMARITNLPRFMEAVSLQCAPGVKEMELRLNIQDPVLDENQKTYLWNLVNKTSRLADCKKEEEGKLPLASMDIGELTAWLMGYSHLTVPYNLAKSVKTLGKVYLDEVV